MPVKVGDQAPDFTLVDTDNKPVSLSSMRGKKVVLAFFPAAFSGACDQEMCSFRDSMAEFNNVNAQVVGISGDPRWTLKEFKNKHGLQFPLLSDFNKEAIKKYGVEWPNFGNTQGFTAATRSIFVVDENGKVRWSWITDQQGKQPDFAAVKSAVHAVK